MSRCKAKTKSGDRCKNAAQEGADYCHVHIDEGDRITHPKKRAMIKALESTLGVVTTACEKVGISRKTHYNWVNSDEQYAEEVHLLQNAALDFAESQLFEQIEDGSTSATIFYLKTKGKKRGYIERQEITGENGNEIKVSFVDANK